MDKVIQEGPLALEVVTKDGVVAVKATVAQSVGGGAAAGVLAAKACVEVDVSAVQAVGLAGALLDAHFPALKAEIDALVGLAQDQLKKV